MSHDPQSGPADQRDHTLIRLQKTDGFCTPDDPRLLKLVAGVPPTNWRPAGGPIAANGCERYPDLAERSAHASKAWNSSIRPRRWQAPCRAVLPRARRRDRTACGQNPLGDFQIVREIGRGGMGIVYEAIQLSLGRRVALKVLPLAATFDAKQLQRFRQEAQAAAQLHHTNIVPVYGVGCERGIHFYAMQLIDGQSLDVVVRQLREEAGMGPLEAGLADRYASSGRSRESSGLQFRRARQAIGSRPQRPMRLSCRQRPSVRSGRPTQGQLLGPFFHPPCRQGAGAVPHDRPLHGPSGRSPGICPSAGHRASRHQAGQSADRLPRQRLDHRLRPGPFPRCARPDADRRPDGHDPLHESRAGLRPAGRFSITAPTSTRWERPSTSFLTLQPIFAGRTRQTLAGRRAQSRSASAARHRPPHSCGTGDHRPQGPQQESGRPLRLGPGTGRRPAPFPPRRADPGQAPVAAGACPQVVAAAPLAAGRGGYWSCSSRWSARSSAIG